MLDDVEPGGVPSGLRPEHVPSVPASAPAEPDDTVGQTALGQALAATGARI